MDILKPSWKEITELIHYGNIPSISVTPLTATVGITQFYRIEFDEMTARKFEIKNCAIIHNGGINPHYSERTTICRSCQIIPCDQYFHLRGLDVLDELQLRHDCSLKIFLTPHRVTVSIIENQTVIINGGN